MELEVVIAVHPFMPWNRLDYQNGLIMPPNYEDDLEELLETHPGRIILLEEEEFIASIKKRMPKKPKRSKRRFCNKKL